MRPGAVALCALCLAASARRLRADEVRYALRAEAGAEHDTNPLRREQVQGGDRPPITASPLVRAVLSADLGAALSTRQSVGLSSSFGGKLFQQADAKAEDVMVAQAAGAYSFFATRRTMVGALFGYYDVFQRADDSIEARDFRSLTPSLRLEQGIADGRLSLSGGWRQFRFKSDTRFDFWGPTGGLSYRHALPGAADQESADWEWSFGGTVEERRFPTRATSVCPTTGTRIENRRDLFWTTSAEATRTGAALLGAGMAVQANGSSCPGESLTRVLVSGRSVFLLPWALTLSARAELVFTDYTEPVTLTRDPVSGVPLVSIEDESRSSLKAELVRAFGDSFDLGLRYTFYTDLTKKGPVDFRRQTLLLFAAVSFER